MVVRFWIDVLSGRRRGATVADMNKAAENIAGRGGLPVLTHQLMLEGKLAAEDKKLIELIGHAPPASWNGNLEDAVGQPEDVVAFGGNGKNGRAK
jgi:hypothetical protein